MKKILITLLIVNGVFKAEAQTSALSVDDYLQKGDYKAAIGLLDHQQNSFEKQQKLAAIYNSIGNTNKAIFHYEQAMKLSGGKASESFLGDLYKEAGLNLKAIAVYESAFNKDSNNLLVAYKLGKLYLARKMLKESEEIFTFLKNKDASNPNYPYQLAKTYAYKKKVFSMGQSYLNAYNIDTLHLNSIYGLAKFFKQLRRKDSTMLFIDKGLAIAPSNLNFLQLKVNELYAQENYSETLQYIGQLSELHFSSANIYEMEGMCHWKLKNLEAAKKSFNKALRSEDVDAQKINYRLGALSFEMKNFKWAKLYLQMALTNSRPDTHKEYLLLGMIFAEERDYEKAIEQFETGIKNNFRVYELYFRKATTEDAYFEDKKIALKSFQEYIDRFDAKDKEMTNYALDRIKSIKRSLFIDGINVE